MKKAGMSIPQLYDRSLLRKRRDRAAANFDKHAFLKEEVADRLKDRLSFIRRTFDCAVELGYSGQFSRDYCNTITTMISSDLSTKMLQHADPTQMRVCFDEEQFPFAFHSLDLIISCLSLHWVNDFPGMLYQLKMALKPDGLLLAAFFGEHTLFELRECLQQAEIELYQGISPRVSAFISTRDSGALLQRAGFALPVVDYDRIIVSYASLFDLMADLKGMGETNIFLDRSHRMATQSLLNRAAEIYQSRYGSVDGTIPATFDIVYLTGWSPSDSQPKALKRGSAQIPLSRVL